LEIRASGDGYGPSDQIAFYSEGIPVIHLFTGAHPEYHSPADDHGTLEIVGGGRISELLSDLLLDLLVRPDRLTYRESTESSTMLGDSRGFGAYLGTIPDYSEMMAGGGGVLLSGVRRGGPADRADIRGGDRIVEMSEVEIRNLYDMTFVLRDHKPGDVIRVALMRKGKRIERAATLGRRGERPASSSNHSEGHAAPGG
jgi:C-terminal processing protease CtpA/Prc